MEQSLRKKLKSLSRDDASFNQLKELFGNINTQKSHFQEHLNLLENAIENDYDSILITELALEKPGPPIVYVNEGFTKITGYSREEAVGKTPRILQGPKTDREVLDRLKRRLSRGRAFFGKTINYKKDGTEFVNQWDIHPLTDEEGNITHWVSYQHDITERKRAEETIMKTQTHFDDLRKHSKSTVIDVDTEGKIHSANKSFRNLTGYAKDELKGNYIWNLFPHKYRNSLKTRFEKQFDQSDFQGRTFQGIIKHKQGLPIQVEGLTAILELKDETIIRADLKNISLQKRIMKKLHESNEKYDKIVDRATEFTYKTVLIDDRFILVYLSDEFEKITDLSAEEIVQKGKIYSYVHKDDVEILLTHLGKVMGGEAGTCEYRIRRPDDTYRTVIDYGRPGICTAGGERKDCVRGAISFKTEAETVGTGH
jgi:PAS domain S-box-containing protein